MLLLTEKEWALHNALFWNSRHIQSKILGITSKPTFWGCCIHFIFVWFSLTICFSGLCCTENEGELRTSAEQLKSERSKRREAENRLTKLEDEISELCDNVTDLNKVRDQRRCTISAQTVIEQALVTQDINPNRLRH